MGRSQTFEFRRGDVVCRIGYNSMYKVVRVFAGDDPIDDSYYVKDNSGSRWVERDFLEKNYIYVERDGDSNEQVH